MADSLIRNRPRYVGLSDRGRLRAENQDRWIGHEKLGLFAVADGMGGQAAGGLASKVVIDALPSIVRKVAPSISARFPAAVPAELCSQLSTLSALLFEEAAGRPGLEGMGSTLAMVLVRGDQAIVAHLGDSRVYRYRNGELELLTQDHNVAWLLKQNDEVSDQELSENPSSHQLTRYLGMRGKARPDVKVVAFLQGDLLLLCSDGLHGQVSQAEIRSVLGGQRSLDKMGQALVDAANEAGGRDNVTVLLVSHSLAPTGRQ